MKIKDHVGAKQSSDGSCESNFVGADSKKEISTLITQIISEKREVTY